MFEKSYDIFKSYKVIIGVCVLCLFGGMLGYYCFFGKQDSLEPTLSFTEDVQEEKKNDNLEEDSVYVDIKGAVKKPGVYCVKANARVFDVVEKAGGLLKTADVSYTNLSKKVVDEMTIYIYTSKEIKSRKEEIKVVCHCPELKNDACITPNNEDKVETSKVAINRAGKEEFLKITGIGEVLAERIVKYREEHGAFESIDAIKNVSGIGDALYQKIKDSLTL